ncbi:MAG: hypothetical protein LRY73_12335 [Bacillus sp. (in: Bacteria)]|nr:hypothetical protein [Bacillus sp. (in: firmicutes)]
MLQYFFTIVFFVSIGGGDADLATDETETDEEITEEKEIEEDDEEDTDQFEVEFSELITVTDELVTIEGSTNLEDGTILQYEIENILNFEQWVDGEIEVNDGSFHEEVDISDFGEGDVLVWLQLNGFSQSEELQEIYGPMGENLVGDRIESSEHLGNYITVDEIHERDYVAEPVVYTGSGDDFIDIDVPFDGAFLLEITGNSDGRHFAVEGFDAADNRTHLFVNTTDPYSGVLLDPQGTTSSFEISGSGSWEITIRSLNSARTVTDSITGTGDEVLLVTGETRRAKIEGNPNARHFAVQAYHPNGGDLLVNTTDVYEGTVRMSPDTFLIEITAVGSWSIEIED